MSSKQKTTGKTYEGFTEEERAAMKERGNELKKAARRQSGGSKAEKDENDVLEKIAEMSESDRAIAERIHAIIKDVAPQLAPRTWYGMPAYAKDGKVLCFFQAAGKFDSRYPTLGFEETANLDDGTIWPVSFALTKLTAAEEEKITALVKKAVS